LNPSGGLPFQAGQTAASGSPARVIFGAFFRRLLFATRDRIEASRLNGGGCCGNITPFRRFGTYCTSKLFLGRRCLLRLITTLQPHHHHDAQ